MLRKHITGIFVALAIAVGLAFAPASAAYAIDQEIDYAKDIDWYDAERSCTGSSAARGCFQPVGDDFWIYDGSVGGDVIVEWGDLNSTRHGQCIDTLGYAKAWVRCNKDFTEGHRITFRTRWYIDGWHTSQWITIPA
ncbi:hypothetical protein AB0A73_21545 [Glycomyces sp. NPDC047369]